MKRLSRGLAIAGLTVAGSASAMPQRLWHGATHFGFDCRIAGMSASDAARFCARLAPVAVQRLKLPHRGVPGPDAVILMLHLRTAGTMFGGTLAARRADLRGETDERSRDVPVSLDAASPEMGFARALALLRAPAPRPGPRRIRPIA